MDENKRMGGASLDGSSEAAPIPTNHGAVPPVDDYEVRKQRYAEILNNLIDRVNDHGAAVAHDSAVPDPQGG